MRFQRFVFAAGATVASLVSSGAGAATLSFDFGGGMTATDLAGAPGVRAGNYNDITSATVNAAVKDNSGAVAAGVTETFSNNAPAGGGGFTAKNGSLTNDAKLFSGWFDTQPAQTVTITGIPYATYDVYFYMHNDTDAGEPGNFRTGQFTVGSASRFARGALADPNNAGSGYAISNDTTQTNPGQASQPSAANTTAGNYVLFSGLSGGTLTAGFAAGASTEGAPRNKVVGFQIVGTPEPAALGLLGSGALGLLARRRRTA